MESLNSSRLAAVQHGPLIARQEIDTSITGVYQQGFTAIWSDREMVYVTLHSEPGPFSVYVPALARILSRLQPDSSVRIGDKRIEIPDADCQIDLHGSSLYNLLPIQVNPIDHKLREAALTSLRQALTIAPTHSQALMALGGIVYQEGLRVADPFVRRFYTLIHRLLSNHMEADVIGLIGLGIGSTPAGDDLLGGMLACNHHMHLSEDNLKNTILSARVTRTNSLSAVLLWAASQGFVSGLIHEAMRTLLAGQTVETKHITALTRIGHTSGLDTLAGLLIAILRKTGL